MVKLYTAWPVLLIIFAVFLITPILVSTSPQGELFLTFTPTNPPLTTTSCVLPEIKRNFAKKLLSAMLKEQNSRRLWWHVFFVTLFLIVPTLAFVRLPGEKFFPPSKVFIQDTTANFVLLCFFYFNYYILLPRLFFTRKYILYAIAVILFLSFASTTPFLAGNYLPNSGFSAPPAPIDELPPFSSFKSPRPSAALSLMNSGDICPCFLLLFFCPFY